MAMLSPLVTTTAIEAREFPELSGHYEVYSVPKIIVNETQSFVGGLPEQEFVDAVIEAEGLSRAESRGPGLEAKKS